jgi:hypothetical protein
VRQQPAGQIRGRTGPEGTKPEAVLQFGHMALSVPLRGEIVLDCFRKRSICSATNKRSGARCITDTRFPEDLPKVCPAYAQV